MCEKEYGKPPRGSSRGFCVSHESVIEDYQVPSTLIFVALSAGLRSESLRQILNPSQLGSFRNVLLRLQVPVSLRGERNTSFSIVLSNF